MKNFNQNLGEMDNSEFYKEVSSHGTVNFNGNQSQPHNIGNGLSKQGVNWVMSQPDDKGDSQWEKKMGTYMKAEDKYTDNNDNLRYEVDLSKHIDCIGMPDESIGGNSSSCGYGQ